MCCKSLHRITQTLRPWQLTTKTPCHKLKPSNFYRITFIHACAISVSTLWCICFLFFFTPGSIDISKNEQRLNKLKIFSETQTQCSWNKDFFPQPRPHEKREIKVHQSLIKCKIDEKLLFAFIKISHVPFNGDLVNIASIFQKYDQKEFTLRRSKAQNVDHIPLKLRKAAWLLKTY